ncbi:MAG: 2-oxo acid dehydrogenase subunit E2 [Deltaproteobacteria bacterium]|nr:2-oxo acid dehydrogenase subunit E2 [Deltaproteobacteria bacterium]
MSEESPKPLVKAVPAARKLAEEKGIDLSLVRPTGPQGTMVKRDVERYLASLPAPIPPHPALEPKEGTALFQTPAAVQETSGLPPDGEGESLFGRVIPMATMRRVVARRMAQSALTAPHIHFFTEVVMERVLRLQSSIQEEFQRRFQARLSVNDFIIKAVALAIREHPLLNATLRGEEIHILPEINVGLAVALEDGLIVPALPRADEMGLARIARTRADLVNRARTGKLELREIERGTFTVSSLAAFEIHFFTAILNPPQSGILTVGKTMDRLYLEEAAVKARKAAQFGLAVDHRIIDGTAAAAFLQTVKKIVENPEFHFLHL